MTLGSANRLLAWALLGMTLVVLAVGWSWMVDVPVFADDLELLTAGLAGISESGLVEAIGGSLAQQSDPTTGRWQVISSFVTPSAQAVALALVTLGVDPASAWGFMRIGWVVLAVLSAAACLLAWGVGLPYGRWAPSRSPGGPWRIGRHVAILGAVLLATVQVHEVWSHDPTLAYPVAGWGSAVAGFGSLACVGLVIRERIRFGWGCLLVTVTGLACVLLYEMLAGACLAVLVVTLAQARRMPPARVVLLSAAALLPLAVRVGLSGWLAWLSRDSVGYAGTQPGSLSDLPGTWGWGMLSSLPLAVAPRVQQAFSGLLPAEAPRAAILVPLVCVAALLVLGWVQARLPHGRGLPVRVRTTRSAPGTDLKSPSRQDLISAAAGTATLWATTTAVIASSGRYQAELGALGEVYTFYPIGAVSVALLLVLGAGLVLQRWPGPLTSAGLVAGLVGVATVTAVWNAMSVEELRYRYALNDRLLTAGVLAGGATQTERCDALAAFERRPNPEYYRVNISGDIQRWYQQRYATAMCPADRLLEAKPYSLVMGGAAHGFEAADGLWYEWVGPGYAQATLTMNPRAEQAVFAQLRIDVPPCLARQRVVYGVGAGAGGQTGTAEAVRDRSAVIRVPVQPGNPTIVDLLATEPACYVDGDARALAYRLTMG